LNTIPPLPLLELPPRFQTLGYDEITRRKEPLPQRQRVHSQSHEEHIHAGVLDPNGGRCATAGSVSDSVAIRIVDPSDNETPWTYALSSGERRWQCLGFVGLMRHVEGPGGVLWDIAAGTSVWDSCYCQQRLPEATFLSVSNAKKQHWILKAPFD